MAINFTDFSRAPILDNKSPASTLFESILKGYKMAEEPRKMSQESQARAQANELNRLNLEHKPKEFELNDKQKEYAMALQKKALEHKDREYSLADSLKLAQINNANQPKALKGALANAFQLRNSLDKNSPSYQEDLTAVNNYINKLGSSSSGVQINTNPEGGVEVSVGGQGQTASIPGLPKLKIGETYLFSEDGKPIGIGKPYSEAEKKEGSGRAYFNVLQPFLNKAQAPYSGQGANAAFEKDISNYTTDAAARDRINNLLAADKLLFSGVVKENATLGGANTNKVYERLIKSLQNSEIYPLLKNIATYQLPLGYSEASGDIFNKKLNEATEAGHNIPAYKPFYFKDQKQSLGNNSFKEAVKSKKTFKTEKEMKDYYFSLSPEQRIEFKKKQLGGK